MSMVTGSLPGGSTVCVVEPINIHRCRMQVADIPWNGSIIGMTCIGDGRPLPMMLPVPSLWRTGDRLSAVEVAYQGHRYLIGMIDVMDLVKQVIIPKLYHHGDGFSKDDAGFFWFISEEVPHHG